MDDDDGASVVSLVISVESVATVATGIESVELGRVEDEVDHMVEDEDHQVDVGDEVLRTISIAVDFIQCAKAPVSPAGRSFPLMKST